MAKPQYTAGFQFIVSTPAQTEDKQARKAIRSHATKAGKARRQVIQLQSWISPNRELGSQNLAMFEEAPTPGSSLLVSSPGRFGSAFSGLQLPAGIEPYMIQDLVKLIDLDKHGIYPYQICLDINVRERGWFPYMINDICCLHSMMFSVRAFTEGALPNQLSRAACLHYAKTLQLLQARLNAPGQKSAISDSTIMVVFVLASAAELMEDFATVTNHIRGLAKIVSLRGGVRSLNTHNNIQVKVCRADLSHALLTTQPPLLFRSSFITYTPFIATNTSLTPCTHTHTTTSTLHAYLLTTLSPHLHATFLDLHAFSCISNLAFQTARKLSPIIYNEIMISVLYRLTSLSFADDGDEDEDADEDRKMMVLQEAVRLGLLVCSTMLYMQRLYMECPYERLVGLYREALRKLRDSIAESGGVPVPPAVVFWLAMVAHVVGARDREEQQSPLADGWMSGWLDEAICGAGIETWSLAREMLREVVWVDFVHDRRGRAVFEKAMLRVGRVE